MQPLLEAIVNTISLAKERYLNAPEEWRDVIETVNSLFPKKDIEKFKELCTCAEYGLSESDSDYVRDYELVLNGDKEDEEEMYDSDNMPADLFEETERDREVREGYLAQKMWKGYKEWLGRRPQELERFEQFMVRNFFFYRVCSTQYQLLTVLSQVILHSSRY